MSLGTIVLAVDFSDHSDVAVERAIELARVFDADLHVVHAFYLPIRVVSPYEVAIPDAYIDDSQKAAREKLAEVASEIRRAGIEATPHLLEVPAATAIAECAAKLEADLIVMGSRGHTRLKYVLFGSVAERTSRLAPCSSSSVRAERTEPLNGTGRYSRGADRPTPWDLVRRRCDLSWRLSVLHLCSGGGRCGRAPRTG